MNRPASGRSTEGQNRRLLAVLVVPVEELVEEDREGVGAEGEGGRGEWQQEVEKENRRRSFMHSRRSRNDWTGTVN